MATSNEEVKKLLLDKIFVLREDIARAKHWILQADGTNTNGMAVDWLKQQGFEDTYTIDLEASEHLDRIATAARSFSLRLAFFHASWELVNASLLVPASGFSSWSTTLGIRTSHNQGGIQLPEISYSHPERVGRSRLPANEPSDPDIFLKGIDCKSLHTGILEAIDQSLTCFRRGLYMPATAMLAAAAEATWTECGAAVAKNLADAKLAGIVADPFASVAKIVSEVRKTLEGKGKPLVQNANLTIHQVTDAEIWTTALRDRRNALHWGKAKSFTADHAETGTLLIAAQQHLRTLEAIRAAC